MLPRWVQHVCECVFGWMCVGLPRMCSKCETRWSCGFVGFWITYQSHETKRMPMHTPFIKFAFFFCKITIYSSHLLCIWYAFNFELLIFTGFDWSAIVVTGLVQLFISKDITFSTTSASYFFRWHVQLLRAWLVLQVSRT